MGVSRHSGQDSFIRQSTMTVFGELPERLNGCYEGGSYLPLLASFED